MDKIEKALAKFSPKEKEIIKNILNKISENDCSGLNTQKLKSHEDIFRVRKGEVRIIYRKISRGKIFVLAIEQIL